jgi:hypothetical protein
VTVSRSLVSRAACGTGAVLMPAHPESSKAARTNRFIANVSYLCRRAKRRACSAQT